MSIAAELKRAVEAAISDGRETPYTIAKAANVQYRVIARWLGGERELTLRAADAICRQLNLELRPAGASGIVDMA